tara:strand:+ start:336 stop:998 length:663 start_codon:yes stop_codon:yes gene_type:complete
MQIGEIVQEDLKKNLATAALAGTLATAPVNTQAHVLPGDYGTDPDAQEVSQMIPKTNFQVKGVQFGMTPNEVLKIIGPVEFNTDSFREVERVARQKNFTILGFPVTQFVGDANGTLQRIDIKGIKTEDFGNVLDFFNTRYGKAKSRNSKPMWNGKRVMRRTTYEWNDPEGINISLFNGTGKSPGTVGDYYSLVIANPNNSNMSHYLEKKKKDLEQREKDF